MKVLVNDTGDKGTTLLQVLTAHWDVLDAETVLAHASTTHPRHHAMLERLKDLGVTLVGDAYPAQARLVEVAHGIDYVFDTGRAPRTPYDHFPHLRGASVQHDARSGPGFVLGGGEDVSGSPRVGISGPRDHVERSLLRALGGGDTDDVLEHELEVQARAETHEADPLPLARFRVRLASAPCVEQVRDRIQRAPHLTSTALTEPDEVFDVGRRFGLGGRLYHQAVVLDDHLRVRDGVVHGSAFVPREGSTVLSTMAAYLQRTRGRCEATRRMEQLTESLLLPRV